MGLMTQLFLVYHERKSQSEGRKGGEEQEGPQNTKHNVPVPVPGLYLFPGTGINT